MRKRMVVSASKKRKNTYPCEQVLDKGSDEGQKIPRRRIKDSGKWEICKNELVAFQQKFGHVNVSSGTNSINQRLGNWAKAQRFQHKLFTIGKDSLMTQERVDQLEALKFGWSSTRQRDYTYLGPDWWKRTGRQTQVSLKRQDAQPGRNAIINAIRFGFGGFEVWMKYIVFHFILKMMLVPSFLSLVLKKYATLFILSLAFEKHLEAKFRSITKRFFHTRCGVDFDLNNDEDDEQQKKKKKKNFLHLNHRPKTTTFERYDDSATQMDGGKKSKKTNTGSVVHSASAFNGKRSAVDDRAIIALKDMTSKQIMKFLGWHWDTHSLPTLFIAYSIGRSCIYYRNKAGVIVGILQLEAGLSIIYTTECHSGLKMCNPAGFQHCSASETDRVLIRFIHAAPEGGLNMDRTEDEWLELVALFLLQTNFPVQNH